MTRIAPPPCSLSVPLSGHEPRVQARESRARFRESLPPAPFQLSSRAVGKERGLEGLARDKSQHAPEPWLTRCPRHARSVALPRLLLLTLHLVPTSAVRFCRTIPSGAFRHQFSAPNQFQSQSIEDPDTVQRLGSTISMCGFSDRAGNSENCCPLTEVCASMRLEFDSYLCRENPKVRSGT